MTQVNGTSSDRPMLLGIVENIRAFNEMTPTEQMATRARRDAERGGATPEEAEELFQRVVSGVPPEQLQLDTDQSMNLASVSPEAFMVLLAAQVGREDQEVMQTQNRIQAAIAKSSALSQRMQALQTIHQRLSRDEDGRMRMGDATIELNGRTMTIAEAVVAYGLDEELNLTDEMTPGEPPTEVALTADSVQSAIETIRQEQQQVTSENEMDMIRMQQAMQQRGQHIQLVSKVLAMLAETDRAIIGNMR